MDNKAILEKANAAVSSGDNEGFLSFCADDTKWTFVGDQTLQGKQAKSSCEAPIKRFSKIQT